MVASDARLPITGTLDRLEENLPEPAEYLRRQTLMFWQGRRLTWNQGLWQVSVCMVPSMRNGMARTRACKPGNDFQQCSGKVRYL